MLETVIRLGASDALFTADRILADVRAAGFDVSKATMYRTLKLLIDARIIERALSTTDQATFRCVFGEAVSQATGELALLRPGHPPAPIQDPALRQAIAAACEAWCKRQGVEYAGYRVEIHAR
jgi:Fe2+ or Zn2+ uptake regulation protein